MTTSLTFRPVEATPIGAFVEGLDPADQLKPKTIEQLQQGLATHGVLIFRGTQIAAEEFVALGRALGELEILPEPEKRHPDHPEIFNLSNVTADGNLVVFDDPQSVFLRGTQRWHTDSSFRTIPCLCTMLNAKEVPPEGGDTLFADMTSAFEALPAGRKQQLENLQVVHSYEYSRANNPGELKPMSDEERAKYPPVKHPLVRTHGDGRRSLYMGGHASHIVGMDLDEGRALLADLVELATAEPFVYRHAWKAGDLVVWDNRSTLHRLTPYDIATHRRVMQRITVAGSEPVV